jgi:hypothetical protein
MTKKVWNLKLKDFSGLVIANRHYEILTDRRAAGEALWARAQQAQSGTPPKKHFVRQYKLGESGGNDFSHPAKLRTGSFA